MSCFQYDTNLHFFIAYIFHHCFTMVFFVYTLIFLYRNSILPLLNTFLSGIFSLISPRCIFLIFSSYFSVLYPAFTLFSLFLAPRIQCNSTSTYILRRKHYLRCNASVYLTTSSRRLHIGQLRHISALREIIDYLDSLNHYVFKNLKLSNGIGSTQWYTTR